MVTIASYFSSLHPERNFDINIHCCFCITHLYNTVCGQNQNMYVYIWALVFVGFIFKVNSMIAKLDLNKPTDKLVWCWLGEYF